MRNVIVWMFKLNICSTLHVSGLFKLNNSANQLNNGMFNLNILLIHGNVYICKDV